MTTIKALPPIVDASITFDPLKKKGAATIAHHANEHVTTKVELGIDDRGNPGGKLAATFGDQWKLGGDTSLKLQTTIGADYAKSDKGQSITGSASLKAELSERIAHNASWRSSVAISAKEKATFSSKGDKTELAASASGSTGVSGQWSLVENKVDLKAGVSLEAQHSIHGKEGKAASVMVKPDVEIAARLDKGVKLTAGASYELGALKPDQRSPWGLGRELQLKMGVRIDW